MEDPDKIAPGSPQTNTVLNLPPTAVDKDIEKQTYQDSSGEANSNAQNELLVAELP